MRDEWRPEIDATLLYVVRGGRILLIHKKRGLGAGKLNGAGGKVDAGESFAQAAAREFEEEVRAHPVSPRKLGQVAFDVVEGEGILIHVFRSDALEGEPAETDEALPIWAPVDEIPYDRMWADDRHWLPHVLAGRHFEAFARFDGDRMLECEVRRLTSPDACSPWSSSGWLGRRPHPTEPQEPTETDTETDPEPGGRRHVEEAAKPNV